MAEQRTTKVIGLVLTSGEGSSCHTGNLLHPDLTGCYLFVDVLQVFLWQIFVVIDSTVHLDVLLFAHLLLNL